MSVLRLSILTSVLLLTSGCGIFNPFSRPEVKQVEIQTKAVERTKLNLKTPAPLQARDVEWLVVTPDNIEQIWQQLKESDTDLVLFALTDNGYEQLALTIAEVRNLINSQRLLIIKYKEYYEPVEEQQKQQQ